MAARGRPSRGDGASGRNGHRVSEVIGPVEICAYVSEGLCRSLVRPSIRREAGVRQANDNEKPFGPLTAKEWLELDHWSFQELPRDAYALFAKLVDAHAVPIERWHDAQAADGAKK